MKVKINSEWFKNNIIRNETFRQQWYDILKDYDFIGDFQFEVRDTSENIIGVRVGFFDKRFYRNKLYITVTPGQYEFIKEVTI